MEFDWRKLSEVSFQGILIFGVAQHENDGKKFDNNV